MKKQDETKQRQLIVIEPTAMQTKTKVRVAAYARVSSSSEDQLNSFSAQISYYTNLITTNDEWELVEVYADEAISGVSTDKRDDFNRMVRDCKKGKIDRIITKSTSRFARNTVDIIGTVRELKEIGVTVFFEKENIDTAKLSGENLLTLYSVFAEQESVSISQNCKKGNRMRMRNGTYVSSNAPYGFRLIKNELTIYEPEAEIIRRIFSEYLAGKSGTMIAEGLSEDEIPRKKDSLNWRAQTITDIIKNERYKGDMLLQKSYREDALPYRKRINHGELPKYYVKATHEGIVSELVFEIAQILLKNKSMHLNSERCEYPLSKLVRCKTCGFAYRRKITRGVTYWVCKKHDLGAENCSAQRLTEDEIYSAFIRMYNKLKANYKTILLPMHTQLEKLREYAEKDNAQIGLINKQIAEISEQSHVMNGLLESGILDSALFISSSDELNKKLRNLKQAKFRLLGECEKNNDIRRCEELIELLENQKDYINEFDETIFAAIVDKIIAEDSVSIDFVLTNGLVLKERL